MREASPIQFPTTDPLQGLQPEPKSLFQKILPISHYGSVFYPDTLLSPSKKFLGMRILRTGTKKNVEIDPVTISRSVRRAFAPLPVPGKLAHRRLMSSISMDYMVYCPKRGWN
jgi:hypothetical protein